MNEKRLQQAVGQLGEKVRPHPRARTYLAALAAGGVLSVALFYGALGALRALDRLTPPPVSGTWCIDNRFAWLRQRPDWKNASLIAVGSSATLRNLNFGVVSSTVQQHGAVNAAPCFLTVDRTRYLTEFLIQRASKPSTAITVLAPRDFQGCSRNLTEFFDPEVADPYIDGKGNAWWLYFQNFRFKDVLIHAIYAGERRQEMKFDRFGSSPLTSLRCPTPDIRLRLKSRCYSELTRLATLLESRHSVHCRDISRHAMRRALRPIGAIRTAISIRHRSRSCSTKAILVDGMTDWRVRTSFQSIRSTCSGLNGGLAGFVERSPATVRRLPPLKGASLQPVSLASDPLKDEHR